MEKGFSSDLWPLDAYKVDDGATAERKSGDLGRRVMSGYYVGTHGRNADVLVMTTQGVVKGNTVHRRPETERWDRSELKHCPKADSYCKMEDQGNCT